MGGRSPDGHVGLDVLGPRAATGPAGRNRPRGPALIYTVRRDLDGHGAHDVTGDASPLVLVDP